MCLSENDEVYSFGRNNYGGLGLGNNENYNSPQLISSLKNVEFIEYGGYHTFCKTLNNEIFCWGRNSSGQLGLENTDNHNTPILCSSLSNGYVLSCGHNGYGQLGREINDNYSSSFQKIEDLSEIIRIECGDCHSLCIDINNDLYVFGNNNCSQLGIKTEDKQLTPIRVFEDNE